MRDPSSLRIRWSCSALALLVAASAAGAFQRNRLLEAASPEFAAAAPADNSPTHDQEPFTPFARVIRGLEHVDRLNAEYGEGPGGIRAGQQDPFFGGGHAWLLQRSPRLDFIRRAEVLPER